MRAWQLAAERGHVGAMLLLASRAGLRRRVALPSKRRQLFDEQSAWLRQAAESSSSEAMWRLYIRQIRSEEATRWLQAAADHGDPAAQRVLREGITVRNTLPLLRVIGRGRRT